MLQRSADSWVALTARGREVSRTPSEKYVCPLSLPLCVLLYSTNSINEFTAVGHPVFHTTGFYGIQKASRIVSSPFTFYREIGNFPPSLWSCCRCFKEAVTEGRKDSSEMNNLCSPLLQVQMVSSMRIGRNVNYRILDIDWCTSDKVVLASDDGCIRVLEMAMKSASYRMDEQDLTGEPGK